ncbi:MAG: hypothetical protein HYX43_10605 [Burkholderiales bacterium]|nr:hypothetical protein [Burkholderiales bacterium]
MAIAEAVMSSPGACAILLDYLPFYSKNRLSDVREALLARGVKVTDEDVLKYNRFEPGDFEVRLRTRLLVHGARRAVVDISTMSKLGIILVLKGCHERGLHVYVLYSEAQLYGPSKEEFERAKERNEIHRPTLQVFTGVHGVVRVDSLASVAMQGQPTAALVFMSFNDALTQILLNTVYPSRLFLINGRPPVHSWREEATAWIHDQVRREWEEDNPVRPALAGGVPMPRRAVSTLNYQETVSLLLQLYWQLSANHRVLLAPAGSKLQAVGCYLVKALHPDIHIEYPSPKGFRKEYSDGVGARWLLDLGHLATRLSAIADAERREYLEIPT